MSAKKAKPPRERRVANITPDWVMNRQLGRKFEWVELDDGTEVCVWSALLADFLQVVQSATRPGVFQELGPDEASAIRVQIMTCCYSGEPPEGERIFEGKGEAIDSLSPGEMQRILTTSSRLNGTDKISKEQIEDFMRRSRGSSSDL
jgi:hypothetical protein